MASYTCLPGFFLVAGGSRICGEGGNWSGMKPECVSLTGNQRYRKYNILLVIWELGLDWDFLPQIHIMLINIQCSNF